MSGDFTLAHISDPHFGTVVPAVRRALLDELRAAPPDLIVLSGDITQRARRAQFQEAREFLAALPPVPRLCVAGNHDLPLFDVFTRVLRPYARFRHYIQRELEPVFDEARVAVIGVDATRRYRHVDGELDARQIERVAQRLARHERPFRIVVTHQPLATVRSGEQHNVAHGAPRALERWMTAGADLFLGGHIHLPYCVEVESAGGRSAALLQAGTCLSHRTRRGVPNSYNRITLRQATGERRMRMERRDFDAARGVFSTVGTHEAVHAVSAGRTNAKWLVARSDRTAA